MTYKVSSGTLNPLHSRWFGNAVIDVLFGVDWQVKNLSKGKDGLLVSNASLAEYNLSLEPKLITARQQLADVYVKAVELQKQHERNAMQLGVY